MGQSCWGCLSLPEDQGICNSRANMVCSHSSSSPHAIREPPPMEGSPASSWHPPALRTRNDGILTKFVMSHVEIPIIPVQEATNF